MPMSNKISSLKIAVIDSGIGRSDDLLKNGNIITLKVEEGKILQDHIEEVRNEHGRDIISIILSETKNIQLTSIRILDENNKGTLYDLCIALNYCIEMKFNIINLSLGFFTSDHYDKIIEYTQKAFYNNTILIAAETNKSNEYSVIANLKHVVGVKTNISLHNYFDYNYEENNIIFKTNQVYVPNSKSNIIKKGNSYIAAWVTSMYSNYLLAGCSLSFEGYLNEIIMLKFLKREMGDIFKEKFRNKTVVYIGSTPRKIKNMEWLTFISDLKVYSYKAFENSSLALKEGVECVFLGAPKSNLDKSIINKIVSYVENEKAYLYMVIPVINALERRKLFEITKKPVITLYI